MLQARLRAGQLLASRGVYGLVWFDEALVVRHRFGAIVEFIETGAPITESVPPLIGLEAEIKGLKGARNNELRLPNVSIVSADGAGPRLNMLFYAFAEINDYMMVVSRSGLDPNLEIEFSRQIRARLMAEAEASAKSKELAQANDELRVLNSNLEQFAAIVTHDLKAPMRAVRYLVDEIEHAVVINDASAACGKLKELRRQTTRLSSMLSALLHYSSAGLSKEAIERVETLALVTEIVRSLPHRGIEVDIRGTWPTLDTLVAPLDLALRNLIDNTVKHHDRNRGRVRIGCADLGSVIEITIEDDGPGIAPEHHASVFLPFRTLANGGEGMGLAIVQKMVDAAGGTITLSSNPAERRGTTFIVRWPKQIPPL
jgi:signal transduction histidine kinase